MAVFEAEHDAPVGSHRHGPEPCEFAPERVKPKTGEIHVVRAGGHVETGEDIAHGLAVIGTDPPPVAALHQSPERPTPEIPNRDAP